MKTTRLSRKVLFLTLFISVLCLTGCKLTKTQATVNVSVTRLGIPQSGISVCQHDVNFEKGIRGKLFADNIAITESDGIASFDIKGASFGFDDKVTLYYVVYDENDNVKAYVGTTVKKGDEKNIEIKL